MSHALPKSPGRVGLGISIPKPDSPELLLEFCRRSDPRYQCIRDRHYVPDRGAHARQLHFLIWYQRQIAGIISAGSAAYAVAARDAFFGVTKHNRIPVLNGLVNNTVFRLEIHEQNLATRILSLWRKVVPPLWEDLYGTAIFGFESFVVRNKSRKGAVYLADNWARVGETSGSTKSHAGLARMFVRGRTFKKIIFCKWRDGFREPYLSECASSWKLDTREAVKRYRELVQKRRAYQGMLFCAFGKVVYSAPALSGPQGSKTRLGQPNVGAPIF